MRQRGRPGKAWRWAEDIDGRQAERALPYLLPKYAMVLRARMGIGMERLTLRHVAEQLGRSVERTRQIEAKAVRNALRMSAYVERCEAEGREP